MTQLTETCTIKHTNNSGKAFFGKKYTGNIVVVRLDYINHIIISERLGENTSKIQLAVSEKVFFW